MNKHLELDFDPTKTVTAPVVALIPGQIWPLNASAYAIDTLTIPDGCLIYVMPGINRVEMTINTLVLEGASTFDLTSRESKPSKAGKPPTHQQAQPEHNKGDDGTRGTAGGNGAPGIPLTFTVHNLTGAGGGSLWIRTDGSQGGPGGDGGDGAKGSAGPDLCTHKGDGGDGGNGGPGGKGGKGGNTAKVVVTTNGTTITPGQTPGLAPSSRPAVPAGFAGIVIAGSPGRGGPGGAGGRGGDGGEGYENHFPCTGSDSHAGAHGGPGAAGATGDNGTFTP